MTAEGDKGEKGNLITIGADGERVDRDTAVSIFANEVTNSGKDVIITDMSASSPEARTVEVNPPATPSRN